MHQENKDKLFFIAAAMGWGAQRPETAWGPQKLKDLGVISYQTILEASTPYTTGKKLNYTECLKEVVDFSQSLAQCTKNTIENKHFPVVIGGDHTVAIGTWSGMIRALNAHKKFGLIWIDAHMDSHTPQTTPSQAIHGMPLAALMGYGELELTQIDKDGPFLDPQHVVLIGVRSFEEGEAALLKKLKVKIYFIEEVRDRGLACILQEAIDKVSEHTQGFGISIDLDALDPSVVPGVGSPEPDGILPQNVYQALSTINTYNKLKGLEIAEYNPTRDINHATAHVIQEILLHGVKYEK